MAAAVELRPCRGSRGLNSAVAGQLELDACGIIYGETSTVRCRNEEAYRKSVNLDKE